MEGYNKRKKEGYQKGQEVGDGERRMKNTGNDRKAEEQKGGTQKREQGRIGKKVGSRTKEDGLRESLSLLKLERQKEEKEKERRKRVEGTRKNRT